jgi:hypothetical protein
MRPFPQNGWTIPETLKPARGRFPELAFLGLLSVSACTPGLCRGRRRLRSALAASTYLTIHQRNVDASECDGAPGKQAGISGHGGQRHEYGRYLEREWRARRDCRSRHDYGRWCVHGACGFSIICDVIGGRSSNCHKWGGCDKVRDIQRDNRQRHHDRGQPPGSGGGARRDAKLSADDIERRPPRYGRTLVRIRHSLPVCLWSCGRERKFHGAADFAESRDRDGDSAERSQLFQDRFGDSHYHQQLHSAVIRPDKRAGGRLRDNRSDSNTYSRVESC